MLSCHCRTLLGRTLKGPLPHWCPEGVPADGRSTSNICKYAKSRSAIGAPLCYLCAKGMTIHVWESVDVWVTSWHFSTNCLSSKRNHKRGDPLTYSCEAVWVWEFTRLGFNLQRPPNSQSSQMKGVQHGAIMYIHIGNSYTSTNASRWSKQQWGFAIPFIPVITKECCWWKRSIQRVSICVWGPDSQHLVLAKC